MEDSTARSNPRWERTEVSRGHSSRKGGRASEALQGRKAERTDRPSRTPEGEGPNISTRRSRASLDDVPLSWESEIGGGRCEPALSEDLLERILAPENLRAAWKRVKANHGAPGIDGVTVEAFPARSHADWVRIRRQLVNGTYRPQPVLRVEIPKRGGGKRPLGIPTVWDRLIQQAIHQELTPLFDPFFSDSSYGFRPNRSAHGAVRRVRDHAQAGYRSVVDLDLEKFFDRVSHDVYEETELISS